MMKYADGVRKGGVLSLAAHLSGAGWMDVVLIARNLTPVLNAVCPTVSSKNRRKSRRWSGLSHRLWVLPPEVGDRLRHQQSIHLSIGHSDSYDISWINCITMA